MHDRFLPPYGAQPNEKDSSDFFGELRDFFSEAGAGAPPSDNQKARLHVLLRKDEWYRQVACLALVDPLIVPEDQNDSPLVEEFCVTLEGFADVTPQMLTRRSYDEQAMQTIRGIDSTIKTLFGSPGPVNPTDELLFRICETVMDLIDATPPPGPFRKRIVRPENKLSPEAEAFLAKSREKLEKAMNDVRYATFKAKAQKEASEAATATATAKVKLEAALKAAKKDKEAAERALDGANTTITRLTNQLSEVSASASSTLGEALEAQQSGTIGTSTAQAAEGDGDREEVKEEQQKEVKQEVNV